MLAMRSAAWRADRSRSRRAASRGPPRACANASRIARCSRSDGVMRPSSTMSWASRSPSSWSRRRSSTSRSARPRPDSAARRARALLLELALEAHGALVGVDDALRELGRRPGIALGASRSSARIRSSRSWSCAVSERSISSRSSASRWQLRELLARTRIAARRQVRRPDAALEAGARSREDLARLAERLAGSPRARARRARERARPRRALLEAARALTALLVGADVRDRARLIDRLAELRATVDRARAPGARATSRLARVRELRCTRPTSASRAERRTVRSSARRIPPRSSASSRAASRPRPRRRAPRRAGGDSWTSDESTTSRVAGRVLHPRRRERRLGVREPQAHSVALPARGRQILRERVDPPAERARLARTALGLGERAGGIVGELAQLGLERRALVARALLDARDTLLGPRDLAREARALGRELRTFSRACIRAPYMRPSRSAASLSSDARRAASASAPARSPGAPCARTTASSICSFAIARSRSSSRIFERADSTSS